MNNPNNNVSNRPNIERRERIATALMAKLMREDMTDGNMIDSVDLAIQGADALIKKVEDENGK